MLIKVLHEKNEKYSIFLSFFNFTITFQTENQANISARTSILSKRSYIQIKDRRSDEKKWQMWNIPFLTSGIKDLQLANRPKQKTPLQNEEAFFLFIYTLKLLRVNES